MPRPTVVVDQIFAITTASDPTAGLKDALLSLVFANAAARAQRSSDPENSVDTFRNAWSSAMGNVGWVITSAGNSQISTQSSRGTTSVADRLMMNAPSSAIETAVDQLKDLSHETGNSDDLLEMWWEAGRQFNHSMPASRPSISTPIASSLNWPNSLSTLARSKCLTAGYSSRGKSPCIRNRLRRFSRMCSKTPSICRSITSDAS